MKRVDYIRNAVEERIGRPLQDTEYRQACEAARENHCKNMEGKILLISISVGGELCGTSQADIG